MRALSRNTRRVTALTLAAALVIAVYLNWQYARTDTGIAADEEAQVVSAEPVQSDTVLDGLPTEAETVSAANKNYEVLFALCGGKEGLHRPADSRVGRSARRK